MGTKATPRLSILEVPIPDDRGGHDAEVANLAKLLEQHLAEPFPTKVVKRAD